MPALCGWVKITQPEQRQVYLTPLPRQAFLLVLEGFSEQDAAHILECDIATLRRLVDDAGRELAAEIATDVLIIEDEALISIDLEALMKSLGHRVIGVARTHAEAIDLANTKQPGLVLADIQLADGSSGLDAVNDLLRSFEVPVIFVTAYPERFLTGERPELDRILERQSLSAPPAPPFFSAEQCSRPGATQLCAFSFTLRTLAQPAREGRRHRTKAQTAFCDNICGYRSI